jgi:predicted acetyltransferase
MEPLVRGIVEIDRTIGAFHNGRVVGTATAHSFELTVPGGHVPLPLVDMVTVQPTHRRRGLLTRMMRLQLDDFRERGEFVAGLTASESSIYARFGWGIASWGESWSIRREHTAMSPTASPPGDIRFVEPDEMRKIWPEIYDRVRRERVGMYSFSDVWWEIYSQDPSEFWQGASKLFHVVYEENGVPEGFVSYRLQDGIVIVNLLIGTSLEAETALWSFCFGIDLMTEIRASKRPVDDPLPRLLTDPRKLQRSVRDELWLRIVDVPAAIQTRSYDAEASAVIQIRDEFCSWNQGGYQFDVSPDGSTCRSTTRTPDLEMDISDLAAVYVGGTTFGTLMRAGRIQELKTGAIAQMDRAFAVDGEPWIVDF